MKEIEVRELEPSEYEEWDLIVKKVSSGTVFHTSEWLKIYREVLSRDVRIYGCFINDELVGGCPLFVSILKGILKVASSTSIMTDYCGPGVKEDSNLKASQKIQKTHEILNALREFLYVQGVDIFPLNFPPGLKISDLLPGMGGPHRFITPIT